MEIKPVDKIEDINSNWEDLIKKSNSIAVFLMPAWITNWLRFLGKKHKSFIFAAWDGTNLVGIFPVAIRRIGLFPFSIKKLEFIGRDDGDYLDFLIDPNSREVCIEAFLSFLGERKIEWDICDFNDFSQESPNYEMLYSCVKKHRWYVTLLNTWKCHYLKIDGDWGSFIKRHGRKFRHNIRRERKQLECLGDLVFKKVETCSDLDRYLPDAFDVHKRKWDGFYISSKFSTPLGQKFYSEVAKDYLKRKMLRLDLLLLNGKLIAFSYSFQWNGRYLYYTPAYDPDYAKYSPGTVLLMYILEDALKSGLREFDFSKGELQYKFHWTSGERLNKRVVFASPTLKGRITYHVYLLHLSIYSKVRKLKSLRIIMGKILQFKTFIRAKNIYIPPDAIVSPGGLFRAFRSDDAILIDYFTKSPLFFKGGRMALYCGLKSCGFTAGDTVLIPAYICESVTSAVKEAGLRIQFYRIKENLEPDFVDLEAKSEGAKALLVVHYFGFPQPLNEIISFCNAKGLILIEDCAHALYSKIDEKPLGTFGNFGVFSLRKTLPIPDGGMLLLNDRREPGAKEKKGESPIVSILSLLEKWAEFKTGISPRCILLRIDRLRDGLIKKDSKKKIDLSGGISPISLRLLKDFEKEAIIEKRRANYQYYLDRLKNRKGLKILIPKLIDGVCPIGFPVLIDDRDRIRKRLLEKRINLRTFWDILPAEISPSEHPAAYEISRKILVLPVHQSLEKSHLDYTIQNLLLGV